MPANIYDTFSLRTINIQKNIASEGWGDAMFTRRGENVEENYSVEFERSTA